MRLIRHRRIGLVPLVLAAAALGSVASAQRSGDAQKHVLVLFASRKDAQFSIVVDRRLPVLLNEGVQSGVDYYSEFIDSPRFSQPEYQRSYCDFLLSKYATQPPDLVITVGTAAWELLARNRERLFPTTPVVFYLLQPPPTPMNSSTGIVSALHFGRSLDLALTLQPDTKHVYVVSGAGAADQRYEALARREFQPFSPRVDFTYLSGLTTRDLDARLRALPPRSISYVVLGTKDGSGQNVQQMTYLSHVASVANGPTYSWADISVDSGIVGGSRRDQLAETSAIATLALQVLHGAHADDIPVSSVDLDATVIDGRQLRRWAIDESRVPPGATVLFREASVWVRYRFYIAGSLALVVLQASFIAGLTFQRSKRRETERQLRSSYESIRHLGQRLLRAQEVERARVAGELHDDIGQQLAILAIHLDSLGAEQPEIKALVESHLERVSTSVRQLSHRLHPAKLRLIGLIGALEGLQRDFSQGRVSIGFVHRDVPSVIQDDIGLCLFRVAQEAMNNAIRHAYAEHVSLHLTGRGMDLELTISDDGVGFDASAAANEGLGLTSIRERVESLRGVTSIQSAPGTGTRLTVVVPLNPGTQETARPMSIPVDQSPQEELGSLPSVLLVDDNPEILRVVASLLEPTCVLVGTATNALQAVRLVKIHEPDVLVLDIAMPGISGFDLARQLKAAGSAVAIVFLSMNEDQELIRAAYALGARAYVTKTRIATDLLPAVLGRDAASQV